MALTRPTFNNINSNVLARFNDPLVVLNAANVSANNQDIGFIFNRGSNGNVSLAWEETIDSFVLAYTDSSGQVDGNINITGNANLQLGNLNASGITSFTGNMTVGHIIPSANLTYDLGSPTHKFRSLYVGANTIYIGTESISVGDNGTWNFTSNGATVNLGVAADFNPPSANIVTIVSETISSNQVNAATIGNAGATLTGSISTSNQPNITSLGTLTGATLSGPLVGTTLTASIIGNTGATLVGTTSNIDGNATVVGNITVGNILAEGYFYANGYVFSGGGGGGTPGGQTGQLQYNFNGVFTGASNVTTNGASLTVGADLTVGGNTTIQGNLEVLGNVTTFSSNSLVVSDPMIYMGEDNTADLVDLGFVASFTNPVYQHCGLVRDASDGVWKLFANVATEPSSTIDFTDATYSPLIIGPLTASSATITTSLNVTTNISRNSRNVPTYTAAASAPASPLMGDFWYNSSTNIMYQYIYDGTNSQWVDISTGLTNASTSATANTLALRDSGGNLTATNFLGTASSAKYADLAENYLADAIYQPGTVVIFGGANEITVTNQSHDTRVAGVISTNPAYLMNSDCPGLPVAFTGRVPCAVNGTVRKGDVLVTSEILGVAEVLNSDLYSPGCVIGKSLEDKNDSGVAMIEIVVGRF